MRNESREGVRGDWPTNSLSRHRLIYPRRGRLRPPLVREPALAVGVLAWFVDLDAALGLSQFLFAW